MQNERTVGEVDQQPLSRKVGLQSLVAKTPDHDNSMTKPGVTRQNDGEYIAAVPVTA